MLQHLDEGAWRPKLNADFRKCCAVCGLFGSEGVLTTVLTVGTALYDSDIHHYSILFVMYSMHCPYVVQDIHVRKACIDTLRPSRTCPALPCIDTGTVRTVHYRTVWREVGKLRTARYGTVELWTVWFGDKHHNNAVAQRCGFRATSGRQGSLVIIAYHSSPVKIGPGGGTGSRGWSGEQSASGGVLTLETTKYSHEARVVRKFGG